MNQDGPSLIIEAPPPPPAPLTQAKDVNVFTYEKLIIYCFSLLYLCLQCDEVFMKPLYLWIQHTVPQDPPKIKKKLITNFHQITSIFYMLLGG